MHILEVWGSSSNWKVEGKIDQMGKGEGSKVELCQFKIQLSFKILFAIVLN